MTVSLAKPTTTSERFPNRSRLNTAAIIGLASAVDSHMSAIRLALRHGTETQLQLAVSDFMADANCLESAIVESL